MIPKDGPDTELLTVAEAAEVLEEPVSRVAHVIGGGGVRPATIVGDRPLVSRAQLREIKRLLAGKRRAREDPVPFPGPGLVRQKAEGK